MLSNKAQSIGTSGVIVKHEVEKTLLPDRREFLGLKPRSKGVHQVDKKHDYRGIKDQFGP
jgi:hypothetical protein